MTIECVTDMIKDDEAIDDVGEKVIKVNLLYTAYNCVHTVGPY